MTQPCPGRWQLTQARLLSAESREVHNVRTVTMSNNWGASRWERSDLVGP